jgi:hypothetical protein
LNVGCFIAGFFSVLTASLGLIAPRITVDVRWTTSNSLSADWHLQVKMAAMSIYKVLRRTEPFGVSFRKETGLACVRASDKSFWPQSAHPNYDPVPTLF